ncbi:DUF58 domain-containing protein [Mycolicibacter arupensis]|uniref:DUF58 domain-containing protein n=1 Tax=Mycolicibacter arupensis TaxID=342002 RepID=A0A5C7YEJ0_9MYCO|nr:DUF58 domain-containing protein [Mycolicibacter arupensis]KAA1432766.1 DUF58 domain-containing protein [Mycolicibacter arupensis]MCV7275078.1 DUF58 domain-containing protein [Mycolicibacter arupensis]OQZ91997.1 hypothetical protein BST15_19410 [Mycolicibacter arupensis]TXI59991.1 MAG: DUF58 domain-containing protein [Mycolicibacter arupensis]
MILTGRTALIALLCAVPIAVAPWPAAAFVVLLAGLALAVTLDVALTTDPATLRVERSMDGATRLGQSTPTTLWIGNGGRRFRGQIRDAWPPSACPTPRSHQLELAAGQQSQVLTQLRPARRGDLHAARVTVRSIGPLGLAGRQQSRRVPGQMRVLPPFLSRRHLPARLARLREADGNLPALVRGQGSEFDSLREYVVGDDVRSIDWRATARRCEVVVRTWRPERDRRVIIVLDTGRTAAGRIGVDPTALDPAGWPRLDWSMDAALLLAALALRAGDNVDLLAHDQVTRAGVFGASRTRLFPQLVDAMASLQPALTESDFAAMLVTLFQRSRRGNLVVLLTDLNASALDEGLLPVLPKLTAEHQVIVAAVADPRVQRLARGRADAAAVYDAGAAERSRNDRRAVAARLRRGGVQVIDAPPEDLAPALADAYLAMKAAGQL